jgi:hypothetical protein
MESLVLDSMAERNCGPNKLSVGGAQYDSPNSPYYLDL